MMTAAIVISLIGMALTVLGLVVKITTHQTTVDVYVREMRRERKVIMLIPMLEMRIGTIENKLGMNTGRHTAFLQEPDEDQ